MFPDTASRAVESNGSFLPDLDVSRSFMLLFLGALI